MNTIQPHRHVTKDRDNEEELTLATGPQRIDRELFGVLRVPRTPAPAPRAPLPASSSTALFSLLPSMIFGMVAAAVLLMLGALCAAMLMTPSSPDSAGTFAVEQPEAGAPEVAVVMPATAVHPVASSSAASADPTVPAPVVPVSVAAHAPVTPVPAPANQVPIVPAPRLVAAASGGAQVAAPAPAVPAGPVEEPGVEPEGYLGLPADF